MKLDRHYIVSNFFDSLEHLTIAEALESTTVLLFEQIFCCGLNDVHNKVGSPRKEKAKKKEAGIIIDQLFYIIDFTLRSSKPYGRQEALAFSLIRDDTREKIEIMVFDMIECVYRFRTSRLCQAPNNLSI